MRKKLANLAAWFWIVGFFLVLAVVVMAFRAGGGGEDGGDGRAFLYTLLLGLVMVLPYFGIARILEALSILVPADAQPRTGRPSPPESPGVTVGEVLDGPGSVALKRRILADLLAARDITQAEFDAAVADPRLLGPARH